MSIYIKIFLSFGFAMLCVLGPQRVQACCGFLVGDAKGSLQLESSTVIAAHTGTRTTLTMQSVYEGNVSDRMAWVIPVRSLVEESSVRSLTPESIAKVETIASPRLVELWERPMCGDGMYRKVPKTRGVRRASKKYRRGHRKQAAYVSPSDLWASVVQHDAAWTSGVYSVEVLRVHDAHVLLKALRRRGYVFSSRLEHVLQSMPWFETHVVVARLRDPKAHMQGKRLVLPPIQYTYHAQSLAIPTRFSAALTEKPVSVRLYTLHKRRMEAQDLPNITIPTNYSVAPRMKSRLGSMYSALLHEAERVNPGAVVTEYAWGYVYGGQPGSYALTQSDRSVLFGGLPSEQLSKYWILSKLHRFMQHDPHASNTVFRPTPTKLVGGVGVFNADRTFRTEPKFTSFFDEFQARYFIHHPWKGRLRCGKDAVRDVWRKAPKGAGEHPVLRLTDFRLQKANRQMLRTALYSDISEWGLRVKTPKTYRFITEAYMNAARRSFLEKRKRPPLFRGF